MAETTIYYKFQYLPLEGKLPGKSFERQTEDAINDLGNRVVTLEVEAGEVSDLAKLAYDTAVRAETTANTAQTTAEQAQAAADAAQSTADSAQAAANAAQETADGAYQIAVEARDTANNAQSVAESAAATANAAEATANDAYAMAQTANTTATNAEATATAAQETANAAEATANAAEATANQAELEASTALTTANANTEKIVTLQQDVDEMKSYDVVGSVDLNDYYTEFARLYVDADSANAPTDTEKFFVDVDVNSEMTQVRQIATGETSGGVWIRYGVLTEDEEEEEPEGAGEGTLVVNGDVSADVRVRGSVQVTGEISGNVEATGTITYGTLTGTATEGATLDEVDIAVDAGTLTVKNGNLSMVDGVLTTNKQFETGTGTDATLYSDMNLVDDYYENALYINGGKLTISEGATITATGTDPTENYGTFVRSGELVVAGTFNTAGSTATDYNAGIYVFSTGKLTVTETGEVNASCAEDTEEKYNCFSVWATSADAVFEVNGVINATGVIQIRGEFTGTGQVYANGELYYDGGGSTGYTVEWGEWTAIGSGSLSGTVGSDTQPVWLNDGELVPLAGNVGSGTQPVYMSNGEFRALTGNVGSGTQPVYMNNGTVTAGRSTVGTTSQPVYLRDGNITTLSATVGSNTKPVYLSNGTVTESAGTVGSATQAVYLNGGELTPLSGTVGDVNTPVYLDGGEFKACETSGGDVDIATDDEVEEVLQGVFGIVVSSS